MDSLLPLLFLSESGENTNRTNRERFLLLLLVGKWRKCESKSRETRCSNVKLGSTRDKFIETLMNLWRARAIVLLKFNSKICVLDQTSPDISLERKAPRFC